MHTSSLPDLVKRIEVETLTAEAASALNGFFPEFSEFMTSAERHKGIRQIITSKYVLGTGQRPRRFSGSASLDRGRYFTLCDQYGDDQGTLVRELLTYWNARSTHLLHIVDGTADSDEASDLRPIESQLNLSGPLLLIKAIELARDESPTQSLRFGDAIGHVFKIHVARIVGDNILDLRRPEAQAWFVEQVVRREEHHERGFMRIIRIRSPPLTFRELLPTLITPEPGGNAFHQSTGDWLRTEGITGLVYPSARSNVSVRIDGTSITSSIGWNYVHYLGAERPEPTPYHGSLMNWADPEEIGVDIKWNESGSAVEWQVSGAEERERKRVEHEQMLMMHGTDFRRRHGTLLDPRYDREQALRHDRGPDDDGGD